jgi:glycosyltransferase involved in cell wall biosynthesis
MLISVVICTRNRADQLGRALATVAALEIPKDLNWEMLLVDNGSSDHTAKVIERFAGQFPIRYVFEPLPGLSNARNRGIVEAQGQYLCWTDDDVQIEKDWLRAYYDAFERHPEAAFFGGPIEPVLEGDTPKWFDKNRATFASILAERNLGAEPVLLTSEGGRLPYGANYAVRAVEQRRHPYDPRLGVSPNQKRLGEETQSITEIEREGAVGYWVPDARVRHIIPASRQTLEYVKSYQMSSGETWAYQKPLGEGKFIDKLPIPNGPRLFGAPIWAWRVVVEHWLAFWLLRHVASSGRWLSHWMSYSFFLGALKYWRREAQEITGADHAALHHVGKDF